MPVHVKIINILLFAHIIYIANQVRLAVKCIKLSASICGF